MGSDRVPYMQDDYALLCCVVQSVAKSAETSASDVRDDEDDDDDDEDDAKLQSSGGDPDRLKAFNVSQFLYFLLEMQYLHYS